MALVPTPLDLRIAPPVRQQIESFITSTGRPDAVATLMVDIEGRWSIGAYYHENIEGLRPLYEEKGWPLLYLCDGLTLAIPQHQVLSALEGRVLDSSTDGYVVR